MGLIADLDFPHVIPAGIGAERFPSMERGSATRSRAGIQIRSRQDQGCCEPAAAAGHRPAVRLVTGIANDTPLMPRAAAEGVWTEACGFLDEELPREWMSLLTKKAEAIYARPNSFRRRLRGAGDSPRDWLWAFMRHWMAALIQQHRPRSYERLPGRYAVGVVKA